MVSMLHSDIHHVIGIFPSNPSEYRQMLMTNICCWYIPPVGMVVGWGLLKEKRMFSFKILVAHTGVIQNEVLGQTNRLLSTSEEHFILYPSSMSHCLHINSKTYVQGPQNCLSTETHALLYENIFSLLKKRLIFLTNISWWVTWHCWWTATSRATTKFFIFLASFFAGVCWQIKLTEWTWKFQNRT